MANENANDGAEPKTLEDAIKVIGELKAHADDLNKGIATYRDSSKAAADEAKKATETANAALKKLDEFMKLNQKKEEGVKLSADEEAKFKAFAKEQGLVSKTDLQVNANAQFVEKLKEIENTAVGEFLEQHPEYDDDEKWKEIAEQFSLYKQPTTLQGYRALLGRIFKDVNPESGSGARAKARAEIINRQRLTIGGGNAKSGTEDADAEIERLQKKYPNLSREQIEETLTGVRSLPQRTKK
jgi:hypothetical protein